MNSGLDFNQTKYELRLAWDVKCLLRMSSGLDMSASLDFYQTKYELRLACDVCSRHFFGLEIPFCMDLVLRRTLRHINSDKK